MEWKIICNRWWTSHPDPTKPCIKSQLTCEQPKTVTFRRHGQVSTNSPKALLGIPRHQEKSTSSSFSLCQAEHPLGYTKASAFSTASPEQTCVKADFDSSNGLVDYHKYNRNQPKIWPLSCDTLWQLLISSFSGICYYSLSSDGGLQAHSNSSSMKRISSESGEN